MKFDIRYLNVHTKYIIVLENVIPALNVSVSVHLMG